MPTNEPVQLESRVGRLEGAMETLASDVQEVARSVKSLAGNMSEFRETVLENIGNATAPKWPLIASFVMLALVIIGMGAAIIPIVLSGQRDAIDRNEIMIEKLDKQSHTTMFDAGYAKAWKEQTDDKLDRLNHYKE